MKTNSIRFLEKHNAFIHNKEKTITHLLLNGINGGKVHLKKKYHNAFLDILSNDIQEYLENPDAPINCITEMKTPVFKLHFDLDILFHPNQDIMDYIYQLIEDIHSLILYFDFCYIKKNVYINEEHSIGLNTLVVAEGHIKPKDDKKKKGIHLYYPNFLTDKEHAIMLRELIIKSLHFYCYPQEFIGSWDDLIDKTIYQANGLRMVGNDKPEKKQLSKNLYYCTKVIMDNQTNLMDMPLSLRDPLTQLKMTSIRYYPEQTIQLKKWLHQKKLKNPHLWKQMNDQKNAYIWRLYPPLIHLDTEIKKPLEYYFQEYETPRFEQSKMNTTDINVKCSLLPEYADVLLELEEHLKLWSPDGIDQPYENIHLKDIIYRKWKNGQFINECWLLETNSKYCMNIDREHNSNHIYFKIYNSKILQYCFCTCSTTKGRKNGICSEFSYELMNVPETITHLFQSFTTMSDVAIKPKKKYIEEPLFISHLYETPLPFEADYTKFIKKPFPHLEEEPLLDLLDFIYGYFDDIYSDKATKEQPKDIDYRVLSEPTFIRDFLNGCGIQVDCLVDKIKKGNARNLSKKEYYAVHTFLIIDKNHSTIKKLKEEQDNNSVM